MPGFEVLSRARAIHWVALTAGILALDYFTGPRIEFPILFIGPVALATLTHGVRAGGAVGLLLSLIRLAFLRQWNGTVHWETELVNIGINAVVLIGVSVLLERVIRQQREIRVLEGMLPICSFCKRIREEGGEWRRLEAFITERSQARFSHTFCEDCFRERYPDLA